MKPLAPNTLLQNRYLIVHLIGKGGMGEVYLAVDQRLGSAIALKRTFFSDDEMLGSAFEREARTLARLRHPVLPKVSDHFTENDTQYLVMEHITGDDLAKRLEITNKPFPLNWVLFWADQLLDALAYLHSHEPPIVHRDIKPQNLKLTDENHIILLDFGLAKNSVGNTRVSTTGGSVVGYTPHYAPMEQIRGTGTNSRSDIYSFAATFYHLLTNTVPPDALTRADNVLNGSPDPTAPLFELNQEVPRSISDVILKGMALSMEQRYASARDMQKALREAYAAMQNAMAAQTMAFNVPSNAQNQSLPQSQQQTEQFSANVATQAPPQNAQPPAAAPSHFSDSSAAGSRADSSQALTEPNPSSPQGQNFEATMKYDAAPFGVKTEVLPKEKMPSAENYAPSASPLDNSGTDQFPPAAPPPPEETADFDASIPSIVKFGEQGYSPEATANFNSLPKNEGNYAPAGAAAETTFPQAQNTSSTAAGQTGGFVPAAVHTGPKKKSGGKALAIAGGLGALGVVVVGAAAIGWYALKPSEATVNPTPTPKIEATAAPTAEPTPEPTVEAITNPTNSSTEIVSSTPENKIDETTENTKNQKSVATTDRTPVPQQTAQPIFPKVTPTPRVVTAKTPAPQKTPPPAAKKTPAKPNPTDILQ